MSFASLFDLDRIAKFFRVFSSLALSGMAIAMVYVIWKGGWTDAVENERIKYLGLSLIILISFMGASIFVTTKRFDKITFESDKFKTSLDTDDEDDCSLEHSEATLEVKSPPNG